VPSG